MGAIRESVGVLSLSLPQAKRERVVTPLRRMEPCGQAKNCLVGGSLSLLNLDETHEYSNDTTQVA